MAELCGSNSSQITIDNFHLISQISQGSFGKIYLARKKEEPNGRKYAIKCISKENYAQKNFNNHITAEKDALAVSRSPFIVSIFYCLQRDDSVYLVMEYISPGIDLQKYLESQKFIPLKKSINYTAQLILALAYIHDKGIIHRDIKPSNILLTQRDFVKLIDFGLSEVRFNLKASDILCLTPGNKSNKIPRTPRQVKSLLQPIRVRALSLELDDSNCSEEQRNEKINIDSTAENASISDSDLDEETENKEIKNDVEKVKSDKTTQKVHLKNVQPLFQGTAYYLSPEILNRSSEHDCRVDVWALGVCFFQLCTGSMPFIAEKLDDLFKMIISVDICWCEEDIDIFSPAGIDFINVCLEPDFKKRPAAVELKEREIFSSLNFSELAQEAVENFGSE
ncbi:MAG: rim15, signal transduction response regulator [Paramarteilia canceri]